MDIKGKSIIDVLMPNVFFSGTFISLVIGVILYPIVCENETIRIAISGAINGIIAIMLFLECIKIFRHSNNKKKIFFSAWAFFLIAILYLVAFFNYGFSAVALNFAIFLLFSAQLYFAAIYLIENKKIKEVFDNFKIYGYFLGAFSIFYIARICFGSGDELTSFCGMDYMTISYAYLVVLVVYAIKIIIFNERHIVNYILFFVFWLTMIYTGTRGPIACVAAFFILLIAYKLLKKEWISMLFSLGMGLIVLGILVFSLFVWSPANSGSAGRLQNFNYDSEIYIDNQNTGKEEFAGTLKINSQNSIKVDNMPFQDMYITYITENNYNMQESLKFLHENKNPDGSSIFLSENKDKITEFKDYKLYPGRDFLHEVSVLEYNKSKIIGNGPMFFMNKYNTYSHSFFYDILCDLGIIGEIIFFVSVLFLFIINFKRIISRKEVAAVALLVATMLSSYLFSGTIYKGGVWVFFFSFATYLWLRNRGGKKDEV